MIKVLENIHYAERVDIFRKYLSKDKNVLEIGPSHNPIAPRSLGYRTEIVDAEDQNALVKKYRALGVDTSQIEKVDYVWRGERISRLVKQKYNNIIASHVIEHIPDPVTFLQDCSEALANDGILHLAVPDATRCFDFLRPFSSTGQILTAHRNMASRHNPAAVYDFYSFYAELDGLPSWFRETEKKGNVKMPNSAVMAYEQYKAAINNQQYQDVHGWVFTPYSFLMILHDLYSLGLFKLNIEHIYLTNGHEFHVVFSKSSKYRFFLEVKKDYLATENIKYLKSVL